MITYAGIMGAAKGVAPAVNFINGIPGVEHFKAWFMMNVNRDLNILESAAWYEKPAKICPAPDAIRAYVHGGIPLGYLRYVLRWNGIDGELLTDDSFYLTALQPNGILDINAGVIARSTNGWCESIRYTQATPTPVEIFEMQNRSYITENCANHLLKRNGFVDPALRDKYNQLRFVIPPIQDQIRFAVREAYNPGIVAQYGYAEEYPQILDKYNEYHGLSSKTEVDMPPSTSAEGKAVGGHKATWGEVYWLAHWELPSPTQAYEMVHRLYAASPYGASPDLSGVVGGNPGNLTFTDSDLSTLLKASDYPTYWRKRLEAISYRPLTRVDVRRMYRMGLIKRSGVYHSYRANGYNDANAELLTKYTIQQEQPQIVVDVIQAYATGLIGKDEVNARLTKIGYDPEQIRLMMEKADLRSLNTGVKTTLAAIKRSFMIGIFNEADLRQALLNAGIVGPKVNQYVENWSLVREAGKKQITAMQIVKMYKTGVLSNDEATSRLQKLNYIDSDVGLIMRLADMEKGKKPAK